MVALLQVVSVVCGVTAITLFTVAMLLNSWLVLDTHVKLSTTTDLRVSLRAGLWSVTTCQSVGNDPEACRDVPLSEFNLRYSGTDIAEIIVDMESVQIRMWIGLSFSVFAFLLLCQFLRRDEVCNYIPQSSFGMASAVAWCLACVSVVSAVSAQVRQVCATNQTFHALLGMARAGQADNSQLQYMAQVALPKYEYTTGVHWALLLCGLGAILCAVAQLTVALWICKRPKYEPDNMNAMLVVKTTM